MHVEMLSLSLSFSLSLSLLCYYFIFFTSQNNFFICIAFSSFPGIASSWREEILFAIVNIYCITPNSQHVFTVLFIRGRDFGTCKAIDHFDNKFLIHVPSLLMLT